ncbi:hypothetical protein GWK47_026597 [Chionoecetes opilio]|uniref:Uncharacterized protein n=1 Tax=Chionoecetes opilio TaxID=41210 RepID=A0A8J8WAR7_CHIOP|nr:hypothetical protein GWK47_026597 [Chionoecetes opilio]
MAPKARSFYSRLADLMSVKKHQPRSSVAAWMRCRLSFSLLRSALLCLRGTRYSTPSNTDIGDLDCEATLVESGIRVDGAVTVPGGVWVLHVSWVWGGALLGRLEVAVRGPMTRHCAEGLSGVVLPACPASCAGLAVRVQAAEAWVREGSGGCYVTEEGSCIYGACLLTVKQAKVFPTLAGRRAPPMAAAVPGLT